MYEDKNERVKGIHIPSPKQLVRHKERHEEKINVAADVEQHISS